MAFIHNVDFEIISVQYVIDQKYQSLLKENKISEKEIDEHARKFNNVIKEINIKWKVIK